MSTTLPTDKNTYLATDKVIRQTECVSTFARKDLQVYLRFMGSQADATELAMNYREGKRIALSDITSKFNELSGLNSGDFNGYGKVTSSKSTTKKGTAVAAITISIPYADNGIESTGDGDGPPATTIQTWSEKSTKYQFPLEVYAGEVDSDDTEYACAGDYQGWLNENGQNAANYKNFKYELSGSTVDLSARTLELAKKHYCGIDSVERSYPEVIRTTVYNNIHGDAISADSKVIEYINEEPNLYHIDDTPDEVWNSKFPEFSWLKVSYDVEIQPTEYEKYWNATVVESWIGISIEERGKWDKNLYGEDPDRWKFYIPEEPPEPPEP